VFVSYLSCPRCDAEHDANLLHNVCDCGSPLLVEYDNSAILSEADADEIATRAPTMWRYREFLPVVNEEDIVSLDEGFTPLVNASALGEQIGVPDLLIKDESPNPTGTFKARGASCGMSMAVALGVEKVALPTAGNAGGAWAAYGAAAGVTVQVAMPTDTPSMNKLECELFGARVTTVDGTIADAGRWMREQIEANGWFDASTLREPYRIEGKKTLGLEIAEQLGWSMPDVIVYPCGGGVGLIGIHRALLQLEEIGWITGPMPRLVVVQAEGCAPIVRAFEYQREESEAWTNAQTIAAGLRVPKALGDFLVLRAVRETNGTAIAVRDDAILDAMRVLAREAGIAAAPEGAATLAGLKALRARGDIRDDERVVLINTGTSLKYPEALAAATR
jgi:threonine synthase